MSFGEIIKNLREERNLTQKEVAISCGFTPTCICQLENGTRNPTGSTVRELANFFDCSADYLLEIKDDFGANTIAPPTAPILSEEDKKLLSAFHGLDRELQELLWDMIRTWQKNATAFSPQKHA